MTSASAATGRTLAPGGSRTAVPRTGAMPEPGSAMLVKPTGFIAAPRSRAPWPHLADTPVVAS